MTCNFLLSCICLWVVILRLLPTPCADPGLTTVTGEAPETVRFAARVQLDSYGVVVADWRRRSHLKPSVSRTARPSALIFWLLLVAGDVEANPGPTSQRCPCTRCGKTVKNFDRGIQCDRCENWTHSECCYVSREEYELLAAIGDARQWFCPSCTVSELPFANRSCVSTWDDNSIGGGGAPFRVADSESKDCGLKCVALNSRSIDT